MAEGGPPRDLTPAIQCTDDDSGNDILGFLADRLNHKINPEEVQQLYDDMTEVVQKNKAKDDYIEELHVKIALLEQQLHNTQTVQNIPQRELQGQGQNRDHVLRRGQGQGCGQMSSLGSVSGDITDRRLNQRLLLKVNNLENENKEVRSMYRELFMEKQQTDGLARQCLLLEDKLKQYQWMEVLYSQKERECENAVKRAAQLQNQLQILKQNVESTPDSPVQETEISSVKEQQNNSLHLSEIPSPQQDNQPDDARSFPFAFPELPPLTQEDSLRSPGNRSIQLGQQTSPQLKRGRFTIMERNPQLECSKCSAFFSSEKEASETVCSYHPKVPVRAILRRGSGEVDPVKAADIFWPCCKQMGKHATKCARCFTHRFTRADMKGDALSRDESPVP